MSLPLSVLSQSGPPKSVGGGAGGGVGGVVYHTSTGQYIWSPATRLVNRDRSDKGGPCRLHRAFSYTNIGVATFFFFFFFLFESGLKLDEKSIENGLEGQKCSVGCLFWGWLPPP